MTITFDVDTWLGASMADPRERETLAGLRIANSPEGICFTEVEDLIAHTVRDRIHVPAYYLARWLLVNWWRLRWEPDRGAASYEWLSTHSMAAISGDYAWPPLLLSSDGQFIQFRLEPSRSSTVSTVRYLNDVRIDVAAGEFEQAVDSFVQCVEERVGLRLSNDQELSELREELHDERSSSDLARECKVQALLGFDPGSASREFLRAAHNLEMETGPAAADEILAVVPLLDGGFNAANAAVEEMRKSPATVDLGWLTPKQGPSSVELPWERGARLARELRAELNIPSGPIHAKTLEQVLGARLPFEKSAWKGARNLSGGYRGGDGQGRTTLLITTNREDNQRFYLCRVIGAALVSGAEEHVLPVSGTYTALQKYERSFAQEFLCPWEALDDFTDAHGTDEEGIADAAEHFEVSERVILTTLVNKKKIPRSRLSL
jgi:hypothetical protein